MFDIMTALATASQAVKLAQELRGIDKAMDAAEYKLKISDLTSALADIKMALTDAKEALADKDAEIAVLKKQFKRSSEMIERAGYKYDKGTDNAPAGEPYCPVCEQKAGMFFHLTDMSPYTTIPIRLIPNDPRESSRWRRRSAGCLRRATPRQHNYPDDEDRAGDGVDAIGADGRTP
jgi:hypothetical protein